MFANFYHFLLIVLLCWNYSLPAKVKVESKTKAKAALNGKRKKGQMNKPAAKKAKISKQ